MTTDWHTWYMERTMVYATFVGSMRAVADMLRSDYIDSVRAVQLIDEALAECKASLSREDSI